MKKYPKLSVPEIILIILILYKFSLALSSSGLVGLFFKLFYILAIFAIGMRKKFGLVLAIIVAVMTIVVDMLLILSNSSYFGWGAVSDFVVAAAIIVISILSYRKTIVIR